MPLDAVAGLVLISVIGGVLFVSITRFARIDNHLADQRTAARRLETALIDLSLGKPLPQDIQRTPLTPPPGETSVTWVRLTLSLSPTRSVYLDGPVPIPSTEAAP